jgi:radical SAM superfamily enzyme YgiQ (UPF0313 family)
MREVIVAVREADPKIKIALGGPLVTSFPDSHHELWEGVDARFIGDGENSFLDWIRRGCPSREEPIEGTPADLDQLGIPMWWDQLHDYVKPASWWPNMGVPSMHIATGRGCTRRCTFCYLQTQYPRQLFRFIGAMRLLENLDALHARLGVTGFYSVDDCFIDQPERRVRAFCEMLIARGSPYRFGCDVQWPDLENHELLQLMYQSRFRCFYLGLEAASSEVRKRLGKGRIRRKPGVVIERVFEMGFVIWASIGIGWPGETTADVEATLELIDSVPELVFDAYRYLPLPNVPLTKLWTRSVDLGETERLQELEFQDYSALNNNFSSIPDAVYENLWAELLVRQNERHAKTFQCSSSG